MRDHLESTHARDVELALSLVEGLLHPDAVKRFTPAQALEHAFLRDPALARDGKSEADVVPHPFGLGVCAKLHLTDAKGVCYVRVWRTASGKRKRAASGGRRDSGKRRASGDAWARTRGDEEIDLDEESDDEELYIEKEVAAGEGIAVGNEPCEFHRRDLGYRFDA